MRQTALTAGFGGLLLLWAGAWGWPEGFLSAYLLAFLFWTGVSSGCLFLLMLHHLVGGTWGFAIRRVLEAGTRTFPLMACLFVPLAFGLPDLYPWARPEAAAMDEAIRHKAPYLNVPFFLVRTGLYFALGSVLSVLLVRGSHRQDREADPGLMDRLQALSGPGLVVHGVATTFIAMDWAMSLEPRWASTVYGLLFLVGQILSTLALVAAAIPWLPVPPVPRDKVLNDLGNLLLASVMLWAYLAYTQYLILWSGDLPEEAPWVLLRTRSGWQGLALGLVVFHFAVPFLFLLSRSNRTRARLLGTLGAILLVMRLADLGWLILPPLHPDPAGLPWLVAPAFVGLGGLWIAWTVRYFRAAPPWPLHDPRFEVAPP